MRTRTQSDAARSLSAFRRYGTPSVAKTAPPSCQTRRFAPALLAFDASSIATDHTSGEGGAIGHIRPFPVYLLNQLITLELVRTRVMATVSSGNGDCKSKLPAWSSRLTVSANCRLTDYELLR